MGALIKIAPTGPADARVLVVGEAGGADEERLRRAFVGASGGLLDKWLTACGQRRADIRVENVVNYHPPANKLESKSHAWITDSAAKAKKFGCEHICHGLWFNDLVLEGVLELHAQIARQRPELIIALGNTPLWALTGREGIAKWRGSELWFSTTEDPKLQYNIPVIPTFHPAYVLRVWEWNRMVVHDLRTRAFGKMADPASRVRPPYKFIVAPTLAQVEEWFNFIANSGRIDLAADIEGWGRVDCIGFAWNALDAICIPVRRADGSDYWSATEWPLVRGMLGAVLGGAAHHVRLVGQNFNYDAQCIEQTLGIVPRVWFDTLAAQHVMLPGTPKDLAYLSSMYRRHHVYWKDDLPEATLALDDVAKWEYNCLDCVATFEVYERQAEALVKRNLWRRP